VRQSIAQPLAHASVKAKGRLWQPLQINRTQKSQAGLQKEEEGDFHETQYEDLGE
jgi:hypothetical protein